MTCALYDLKRAVVRAYLDQLVDPSLRPAYLAAAHEFVVAQMVESIRCAVEDQLLAMGVRF